LRPPVLTRDMLVPLNHKVLGGVRVAGVGPKLSRTPGPLHHSDDALGRDTPKVLQELVGLSVEKIAQLSEKNTVK
jgi:crotonobetainyl-CoA:carnitine CoA-transferase CaiB-like acyl-CoA transferase